MHVAKLPGYAGGRRIRPVDQDRQEERNVFSEVVCPIDRQVPFATEIAFAAGLGVGRDDRNEETTGVDSVPNLPVPNFAAPQFVLIEPDRYTCVAKGVADPVDNYGIL
jgi:hypothetical protein